MGCENVCVRRIRLLVTEDDRRVLDSQSKKAAWLYNQLKERADALRAEYHATQSKEVGTVLYAKYGLRNLIPGIKKEAPFLCAVHSSPLKNAGMRLTRAVQAYRDSQNGTRKGPPVAWPRFHKWRHEWFSLEYEEPHKGFRVEGKKLRLSLGQREGKHFHVTLKIAERAPSSSLVRGVRVVREGGDYFAVFTVRTRVVGKKDTRRAVAIDPNQKNFGYGVDTEGHAFEMGNLHGLKEADKRIDALKSKRDCCMRKAHRVDVVREDGSRSYHYRPSRRWYRLNKALQRVEKKRRERTKHFMFSTANRLCQRYDLIGGDWAPRQHDTGLGRKANRQTKNRSLVGRFKQVLQWVAKRSGKECVVYDEKGTTRTCSACHYEVPGGIHPSVRRWMCPCCQTSHDRDENSAQNGLLRLARNGNLLLPRSGPVVVISRSDWLFHPQGWSEMPKGDTNVNQTGCFEFTKQSTDGVIAPNPEINQV